jgi:prepilin-type N-terminal cleavage/methylation domain-containing protein
MHRTRHRSAFTLIELLVVIAIIAILAVVVVLTLNPAQLLAQSRDANRVSDMSTLNDALNLYSTDQSGSPTFSLGSASTTYISVPDPTAPLIGNACTGLGLPSLPTSTAYYCAASTTFRLANGNGWLPVNFSNMSGGAPFGSLPVDQINTTSSGDYYAYLPGQTAAGTYELISRFESQKYTSLTGVGSQTGGYSDQYDQVGKDLTLALMMPEDLDRVTSSDYLSFDPQGLVGYWPLNEGSGNIAHDQSGNGDNGTSAAIGWSTSCPVGVSSACIAVTSSNGSISIPSSTALSLNNNFSMGVWVKLNSTVTTNYPMVLGSNAHSGYGFIFDNGGTQINFSYAINYPTCDGSSYNGTGYVSLATGTWQYYATTYNGSTVKTYLNGSLLASQAGPSSGMMCVYFPMQIASPMTSSASYNESEARIYNRVLSAQEIQAIYLGGL